MVEKGYTPIDQIADKYEQMNPKFNDGKYGSLFMWGLGTDYAQADMLGEDKIHMTMVPQFSDKRYIFTDSWSYVLNTASQNKEAAIKFLLDVAKGIIDIGIDEKSGSSEAANGFKMKSSGRVFSRDSMRGW
jgi:multiple sugar transport system substrate-binding protein